MSTVKLLINFFDFAYYTGFSPFRVVFQNGKYVKSKNSFHTCLSAIFTLLILHTYLAELSTSVNNFIIIVPQLRPISFFRLMVKLTSLLYTVHSVKIFWFDGQSFVNFCNALSTQKERAEKNKRNFTCRMIIAATIFELSLLVICKGALLITPIISLSPELRFEHLLKAGNEVFYQTNSSCPSGNFSQWESTVGLVGVFIYLPWYLFDQFFLHIVKLNINRFYSCITGECLALSVTYVLFITY